MQRGSYSSSANWEHSSEVDCTHNSTEMRVPGQVIGVVKED